MATKVQMTKGGKKLCTINLSIFFKLQGDYFFFNNSCYARILEYKLKLWSLYTVFSMLNAKFLMFNVQLFDIKNLAFKIKP